MHLKVENLVENANSVKIKIKDLEELVHFYKKRYERDKKVYDNKKSSEKESRDHQKIELILPRANQIRYYFSSVEYYKLLINKTENELAKYNNKTIKSIIFRKQIKTLNNNLKTNNEKLKEFQEKYDKLFPNSLNYFLP